MLSIGSVPLPVEALLMPAAVLSESPKCEHGVAHRPPFPDSAADEKAQLPIIVRQAAAADPSMAKQNQISAALFPTQMRSVREELLREERQDRVPHIPKILL